MSSSCVVSPSWLHLPRPEGGNGHARRRARLDATLTRRRSCPSIECDALCDGVRRAICGAEIGSRVQD